VVRVGVAGEDLGVAQWNAGVEGVGDRRVPQRVRADVAGDAATLAIRSTIRETSRRSTGFPDTRRRNSQDLWMGVSGGVSVTS
jgi:hypothetical protein